MSRASRARYRESRDCVLAALKRNFGEVEVQRRTMRLAPALASAAGRSRRERHRGGGARAAHRRQWPRDARARRSSALAAEAARLARRLRRAVAAADRVRGRPPFRGDRRRHRRSHHRRQRLPGQRAVFSKQRRSAAFARRRRTGPAFSPATGAIAASAFRSTAPHNFARSAERAMATVSNLYVYPIKGLSAQALNETEVAPDRTFPHDREFALARPQAPIDAEDPKWAKKAISSC